MRRPGPGEEARGAPVGQPSLEQRDPLLQVKLFVPAVRAKRVSRPRLMQQLNRGLEKALILVAAPAGYGKTTLISDWLSSSRIPAAWLSLDEGDNDPLRFLRSFVAALQRTVPTFRPDLLGVLQGMRPGAYEDLLSLLANEVRERAPTFAFVLDDFHLIESQPVVEMVSALLEYMPAPMHLILLSRTDPPVPLHRLRARDQVIEIRAEQLRFTPEETAIFLNDVMGLGLSLDDLRAMEARTEGWIAGLQLAALSMQGCDDTHAFVESFAGSHSYIIDYLTEEALKLQPENIRSFLLQTSILASMNASLCDAVTGRQEPGAQPGGDSLLTLRGSQSILEYLERANLFVIPLDVRRQWYRYHHLFADVLGLRLEHQFPERLRELHARASCWYEQNDLFLEATHHALLARDHTRAAELVEQHGCALLMQGEGFTLLKWVEAVEPYAQLHPWLAVLKAWGLALTGQVNDVEACLQTAERLIVGAEPTPELQIVLGSIASVRAFAADLHGEAGPAIEHAQRALAQLPEGNAFSCSLRSVAVSILGDASWLTGDVQEAETAYRDAVHISQAAGNVYMTLIASANLADALLAQGRLHEAARLYAETLRMATRPDGQKLPLADRLYAGLGKIAYEWNQLDSAAEHVRQCIALSRQWGNAHLLANAFVLLAWLERTTCHLENAREAILAAEQIVLEKRLSPRQSAVVEAACARWWLAQGELESAGRLAAQRGARRPAAILRAAGIAHQEEPVYVLLTRLLLAQGDDEAALSLARRMLPPAEMAKRVGRVVELLILQALALQGLKDPDGALAVLEQALALARPESYARTFLDEGEAMFRLLYQARTHRIGGAYVSELLAAVGGGVGKELPPAQLLIEPLTGRELEVLRLIQKGCSNLDIADRLVISVPTVKRHISNIYAKLGVSSRTQAVSLSTELKLLN